MSRQYLSINGRILTMASIVLVLATAALSIWLLGRHRVNAARAGIEARKSAVLASDPEQLRQACQMLLVDPKKFAKARHTFGYDNSSNFAIDPRDINIPEAIRQLEAAYIVVEGDVLTVELGGGFNHYGILASLPQRRTSPRDYFAFPVNQKMLADGTWFYEEVAAPVNAGDAGEEKGD